MSRQVRRKAHQFSFGSSCHWDSRNPYGHFEPAQVPRAARLTRQSHCEPVRASQAVRAGRPARQAWPRSSGRRAISSLMPGGIPCEQNSSQGKAIQGRARQFKERPQQGKASTCTMIKTLTFCDLQSKARKGNEKQRKQRNAMQRKASNAKSNKTFSSRLIVLPCRALLCFVCPCFAFLCLAWLGLALHALCASLAFRCLLPCLALLRFACFIFYL